MVPRTFATRVASLLAWLRQWFTYWLMEKPGASVQAGKR